MSELIVIGYQDPVTAKRAYDQVLSLQKDLVVELRGLAIVSVDQDGKSHVDTPQNFVGTTAVSGALWGLLLGVLFFVPGLGLVGGALGALFGKLSQSGVDEKFRSQVRTMLEPGRSAVVIMASKLTQDKFAAAMKPIGGDILKTSLSDEAEKELAEEISTSA